MRLLRRAATRFLLVACLPSCLGSSCGPPDVGKYDAPDFATLRVKVVSSDPLLPLDSLSVRVRPGSRLSDGAIAEQQTLTMSAGTSEAITVDSRAPVEVTALLLSDPTQSDSGSDGAVPPKLDPVTQRAIMLTRTARGRVPLGESVLVLSLDPACLFARAAPTCGAGMTCSLGRCTDDGFGPEDLLSTVEPPLGPDPCVVNGPPDLVVGTGENTVDPVTDGTVLPLYAGNQGGHHVLVSIRTRNVHGNGTSILLRGVQPGTGAELPTTAFVVPFTAMGDQCEVTGLRYQLDNGSVDYRPFVGKPLDLSVTVREPSGVRVSRTVHVQVGP